MVPPDDRSADLFARLRTGDRVALAQAITLVESQRSADREAAAFLVGRCLPLSGQAVRIGISGAPGAGKSTLIDAWGTRLTGQGHRVAVLAIDPSSGLNRGSILGDKTRMDQLSRDPMAFIRPSPAGHTLGGVARKTRETILLCEAAGFDHILIETVGVGQSETAVRAMTDLFLLLLIPGAGDDLQGIKRGIMEMADLITIHKADDDRLPAAELARSFCTQALHLFPARPSGQPVDVLLVSSLHETGIDELDLAVHGFLNRIRASGYMERQRREQAAYWLTESLNDQLNTWFHTVYREEFMTLKREVLNGHISPFDAAETLMRKVTGHEPEVP